MRRRLLKIAIVLLLGAPVAVLALAPSSDDTERRSHAAVIASAAQPVEARPALPEQAAMVLAGSLLIGVAAAVRRAA